MRCLLHLSREQASCRGCDADIWILRWGEAEQPGYCRSHGALDHRSDRLFGLVTAAAVVDQIQDGGGLVTDCCGPKMDQRVWESQRRTDAHSLTGQQEISGARVNKSFSYVLTNMEGNHIISDVTSTDENWFHHPLKMNTVHSAMNLFIPDLHLSWNLNSLALLALKIRSMSMDSWGSRVPKPSLGWTSTNCGGEQAKHNTITQTTQHAGMQVVLIFLFSDSQSSSCTVLLILLCRFRSHSMKKTGVLVTSGTPKKPKSWGSRDMLVRRTLLLTDWWTEQKPKFTSVGLKRRSEDVTTAWTV